MWRITAWMLAPVLTGTFAWAVAAQDIGVTAAPYHGLLVLRNGHVLRGQIAAAGDRYYVALASGEISLRRDEVELACRTLDEAYRHKQAAIPQGDVEGRLALAEWCLQEGLSALAAKELRLALTVQPDHPRIAHLERRLRLAVSQGATEAAASEPASGVPTFDDLERMVRGMPAGAVSTFAGSVQPLLLNTCATGDCHGPQGQNGFHLLRVGANRSPSRRLTMRNLASTLEWVDRTEPERSRLLTVTTEAHGTQQAPLFANERATQYRQLAAWVSLVASGAPPVPATVEHEPAPLMQYMPGQGRGIVSNAGQDASVGANGDAIDEEGLYRTEDELDVVSGPVERAEEVEPSDDPFDPERFNRRYFRSPALVPPSKGG